MGFTQSDTGMHSCISLVTLISSCALELISGAFHGQSGEPCVHAICSSSTIEAPHHCILDEVADEIEAALSYELRGLYRAICEFAVDDLLHSLLCGGNLQLQPRAGCQEQVAARLTFFVGRRRQFNLCSFLPLHACSVCCAGAEPARHLVKKRLPALLQVDGAASCASVLHGSAYPFQGLLDNFFKCLHS
jgi:hypothetical protein